MSEAPGPILGTSLSSINDSRWSPAPDLEPGGSRGLDDCNVSENDGGGCDDAPPAQKNDDDGSDDGYLFTQESEELLEYSDDIECRLFASSRMTRVRRGNSNRAGESRRIARVDRMIQYSKKKRYQRRRVEDYRQAREEKEDIRLAKDENFRTTYLFSHEGLALNCEHPYGYGHFRAGQPRYSPYNPAEGRIRDLREEEEAYGAPVLSAADLGMDQETYNMLVALQLRDIRPEDYGVLSALDEAVEKPKLEEGKLAGFPTAVVEIGDDGKLIARDKLGAAHILPVNPCLVCYEEFEAGESIKRITCGHTFHRECIDTWFSQHVACPVDRIEPSTPPPECGFDFGAPQCPKRLHEAADIVAANTVKRIFSSMGLV